MKEGMESHTDPAVKKAHISPNGSMFSGIREKLVIIFVIIKVLPLVALAFFAAHEIGLLGTTVKDRSEQMVEDTQKLVTQIGSVAAESSIKALDLNARERIERLTTDTAQVVADFLYQRDADILLAATLPVNQSNYGEFLSIRKKNIVYHEAWQQSEDGTKWLPPEPVQVVLPDVSPKVAENNEEFHYRQPQQFNKYRMQPLYHEMTFIDLTGREKIKVSMTPLLPIELRDVSDKSNTWCKAETYFSEIKNLQQGDFYVSQVIGPYLPSKLIGPYTRARAEKKNIPFEPEQAGYAGKENPVGKRFQGIIRWASPVFQNGEKIGYVTFALDHTHLMEFTDHVIPTAERYSDISDAGSGNYAFMWDYEGRNISHPRDYFIVGYDPLTGEQAVPWLSAELYEMWQGAGESFSEFEKIAPRYLEQSRQKKPSGPLTEAGMVGIDCRYLNFAPQCGGWADLTQYGGSGSFVIAWSKLLKLTTAATIPYYSGIYKDSPRGFGFVTIGANVDEIHSTATETAALIDTTIKEYETNLEGEKQALQALIDKMLGSTMKELTISTLLMIVIVIFIAIWMASVLTGKITTIISGIRRFQSGHLDERLKVETKDELGQLAGAFNELSGNIQESIAKIREAKDRAEESDKAKSLFLANMSHEIRTPMNAIIGMNRLALGSSENEDQRKLLDSVEGSADSLLAIINDILDFSKIEADQIDLESHNFSLFSLVQSVMKSIDFLAKDKDVAVSYALADNVPNVVRGDSMRLRQILLNLLNNGVKFTEQGLVSLEVRVGKQEGERIEIYFSVRDTGIGIPPEDLGRIFERFSQSDQSITRKHQGTGLGLAISTKLCHLMGGDISVESDLGKGSTFTFFVVFEEADSEDIVVEENEGEGSEVAMESLRILLVEDNETNRELARMVLEQEGHQVVTVESGLDALQALVGESFDVVLMDVQMPGMDGFTATQIIRQCEAGKALSSDISESLEEQLRDTVYDQRQLIIALTAHAMLGDKQKCLAAGMDGYLTKPFQPAQVVAELRRHVGNAVESQPESESTLEEAVSKDLSLYQQAKENLREIYALEDEQIDNLLMASVTTLRESLDKLAVATTQQDLDQIQALAHSMKGSLLNLRLAEPSTLAGKIEQSCKDGDGQGIGALAEELRHVLKEFIA